jgi:hypothetical protein
MSSPIERGLLPSFGEMFEFRIGLMDNLLGTILVFARRYLGAIVMISIRNELDFPEMLRVGETNLGGSRKNPIPLFRLDWVSFEERRKAEFQKWLKKHWSEEEVKFIPRIPEARFKVLNERLYFLNRGYSSEIRRNARRAQEEWGHERPFDTCIRDQCLTPAQSHVEVAFMLLADCAYDKEEDQKLQGPEQHILDNEMLIVMWARQTGGGLIRRNSKLHKLQEQIDSGRRDQETIDTYAALINDFEELSKRLSKENEKIHINMESQ